MPLVTIIHLNNLGCELLSFNFCCRIIFQFLQSTRQNERNSKIRLTIIFNFVKYFLQVCDVALPSKFCRRDNVGGDATGRTSDSGCSSSGKEETWSREGAQKIHMEATINLVVLLMTVLKERRRFCVTFLARKFCSFLFLVVLRIRINYQYRK